MLQAAGVLVEGPSSHPFDEDGPKGFLRCEGTGALVLRRLHDAEAHGDNVICEIAGAYMQRACRPVFIGQVLP